MKTPLQELIDFIDPELKMHDFSQLPAYEKAKSLLSKEKQYYIDVAIEFGMHGKEMMQERGEEYYNTVFR